MALRDVESYLGPRPKIKDSILQPLSFPEDSDPSNDEASRCFLSVRDDAPISCLLCGEVFDFGREAGELDDPLPVEATLAPKDAWLRHLLLVHKTVVDNVAEIASFKCYSEYWKSRLSVENLKQYTAVIKTNTRSSDDSEYYYLLSDALPEDKELRHKLQQQRLEVILEQQHRERVDCSFSGMCLFCSQVLTGNRAMLFQHMLHTHSFNIGQPDNIVFVGELLDLLRAKLDRLQCLYCERTFRDHAILKEHMRKKQHKKISPQNKQYDRFYTINYLELGKNWEQLQSEDDHEIITEDDNEWSDWKAGESLSVFCLFCSSKAPSSVAILQHMQTAHGFDLLAECRGDDGYYTQVKAINFIRRMVHMQCCVCCLVQCKSRDELLQHMGFSGHFKLPPDRSKWDQSQYLFPTYENDALLYSLDDS